MAVRTKLEPLSWRRAAKDTFVTGTKRRRWLSQCRGYSIEEHKRPESLIFLAYVAATEDSPGGPKSFWRQIGFHRTRMAAVRTCEQHRRAER